MKNNYFILIALMLFNIVNGQIPTDSLVAYYSLNGNGIDSSVNGNHSTLYGAVATTNRFGSTDAALLFDGVDDYIELPSNCIVNSNHSFSISVWISKTEQTLNKYISDGIWGQSDGLQGSDYPFAALRVVEGGFVYGTVRGTDNNYAQSTTSDSINDGNWHHICFLWNHNTQITSLFVDGVIEDSDTVSLTGDLSSNDWAGIGAYVDDLIGLYHFFNGKIDDFRLYKKVLSPTEIQQLLNEREITSLMTAKENFNIEVFPNPSTGMLNVKSGNSNAFKIKIISSTGITIYDSNLLYFNTVIDLKSKSLNGLYFLQIIDEDNRLLENRKLIFQ